MYGNNCSIVYHGNTGNADIGFTDVTKNMQSLTTFSERLSQRLSNSLSQMQPNPNH